MTEPYVSEATLRVRYAETDAQGIVYYANYFVWFEVGRVNYLREVGLGSEWRHAENTTFVIAEATCRYHAPARFDDRLRVRTWVSEVKTRSFRFAYEVHNQDSGALLAEGETTQVVMDSTTFEPRSMTPEFRKRLFAQPGRST